MNKLLGKMNINLKNSRLAPYGAIAALLIIGWLVLFHSGLGFVNSAQAQVNPGRIGDSIVEQVTGAAAEREGDLAEAEAELTEPGSTEIIDEGAEFPEEELPPGESVVIGDDIGDQLEAISAEAYTVSSEGLGGSHISDLDETELMDGLLNLEDIGGNPFAARVLLPIIIQFQAMVNPPFDYTGLEEEELPWISEARRYSPFDAVGITGQTTGPLAQPIPPFQPIDPTTSSQVERLMPSQVAQNLLLKGVMGNIGDYFAIIAVPGIGEKVVRIGEEIYTRDEDVFVVSDINLSGVRITNQSRPNDPPGLVQFVARESAGIAEFSISN